MTEEPDDDATEHQRHVAGRLDAVKTLAAGLGHEIHNPLNAALLQLALARRRLETGANDVLPALDAAEAQLQRLSALVRTFSTSITPAPLEKKRCAVAPLIKRTLAVFRVRAEARQVLLVSEVEKALPMVVIDRARVTDALGRLLENALEASPEGGIVRVSARSVKRRLEITVANDGEGLPDLVAIFDPFFTTKPGSPGLGLAIVHRTMLEHGGAVRVRCGEGQVRFTLSLPTA